MTASTNAGTRERSWWGWGWKDRALGDAELEGLAALVRDRFGTAPAPPRRPPDPEDLALPAARLTPPQALAHLCASTPAERASHALGKAFRDVARALDGLVAHAPDAVAYPCTEADVVALLEWCSSAGVAAIPFGGGTSVVGGIEPDVGEGYAAVLSIDLRHLDRVVEIDTTSRAARIQAGVFGPHLEEQLRPAGLTLRHFPQSFEHSTLGGWLATRAGGHYATNYTHIDDFVESLRVVTPSGTIESRRLPGSGAGPSPDRLFLGSEGTLGVVTEAWLRLQDRPRFRSSASVRFPSFEAGAEAARAVAQAALFPANCRLIDPHEAALQAGVDDGSAVLVLGFESADHPVDRWIERALELCADLGGTAPEGVQRRGDAGTAGTWRDAFFAMPYARDALVRLGCVAETFETACTWSQFPALHEGVTSAVEAALREVCGAGFVTCRFTHVYPDGPAPYYTVLAPGRPGALVQQWDEVKRAASDALLAHGGTITHHHAVGRNHRPWYTRQRPDLFGDVLRAAKTALDPAGVLNPGVLLPPLSEGREQIMTTM